MQLDYDSGSNSLLISSAGDAPEVVRRFSVSGILDIAEGGRLAGIELNGLAREQLDRWVGDPAMQDFVSIAGDGSVYVTITSGDDRNVRSVAVAAMAELGSGDELVAIGIPRRGAGYEISYPSGNQ